MLDIDGPIGEVLGDAANPKAGITLAQIMSNSSGLPAGASYAPYVCQWLPDDTLTNCTRTIYATEDAADRVPPDTEFRYGGGVWQAAGGVAEIASGKSWADLVRETYVEPCGLTSLGFNNASLRAQQDGDGNGYPSFFQGNVQNLTPTSNPNIQQGAYVTVSDYAQVLLLHLRGGLCGEERVLTEASVERMREDRIASYGGVTYREDIAGYGLGWFVDRDDPGQFEDRGAYGAIPWIDTERGYGVFIAIESVNQDGTDLRNETQRILEEMFPAD